MKAGVPHDAWSRGDVTQLALAIQHVPRSLSGADVAAQLLLHGLDEVLSRLKPPFATRWRALSTCRLSGNDTGAERSVRRIGQARHAGRGYGDAVPSLRHRLSAARSGTVLR